MIGIGKRVVWGKVPLSLLELQGLTFRDLRVFIALSSFTGHHRTCFPSLEQIHRRSGVPLKKISACAKRLESFGVLRRVRRGKRLSNSYEILVGDSPKSGESLRGISGGDSPKSGYVIPPNRGNVIPPNRGNAIAKKSQQPIDTDALEGAPGLLKEQLKVQLKVHPPPPTPPPAADDEADFLTQARKRLTRRLSEQEILDLRELSKEPGFFDALLKLNGSVRAPVPFLRAVLASGRSRYSLSSGSREKSIPYPCPDCGQLVESQFERCKRCYPPENVFARVGTNGDGTG
jgi:hypothetical protein